VTVMSWHQAGVIGFAAADAAWRLAAGPHHGLR
jgi:hypothetical protein